MPTYEYECPACGVIEVVQSMKDKTLTTCPQCKKRKVTKLISSGAGVIFKGDGFWETDYNRSKDYSSKQKSESAAPASPPAASPAGGDAKPATPAPTSEAKPAKAETKPAKASKATKPPATTPGGK